jgi:hypothetical protein
MQIRKTGLMQLQQKKRRKNISFLNIKKHIKNAKVNLFITYSKSKCPALLFKKKLAL